MLGGGGECVCVCVGVCVCGRHVKKLNCFVFFLYYYYYSVLVGGEVLNENKGKSLGTARS